MKWEVKKTGKLTCDNEDLIVIKGLLAGKMNNGIAKDLGIARRSVDYRIRKLKKVLGAKSRAEIVLLAYLHNLIEYEKPNIS